MTSNKKQFFSFAAEHMEEGDTLSCYLNDNDELVYRLSGQCCTLSEYNEDTDTITLF